MAGTYIWQNNQEKAFSESSIRHNKGWINNLKAEHRCC